MNDSAMTVVKCIQEGRWSDATEAWGQTQEVIENSTNGVNFYNILKWGGTEPSALFAGTCYCILIFLKEHKVLLIATVMILSFQIDRLWQTVPNCTEAGYRLGISDLGSRGIVLSVEQKQRH